MVFRSKTKARIFNIRYVSHASLVYDARTFRSRATRLNADNRRGKRAFRLCPLHLRNARADRFHSPVPRTYTVKGKRPA